MCGRWGMSVCSVFVAVCIYNMWCIYGVCIVCSVCICELSVFVWYVYMFVMLCVLCVHAV